MQKIRPYKVFSILVVTIITAVLLTTAVFAEENAVLRQYYSDEGSLTFFVSDIRSENPASKIAGIECQAENLGSVYYEAEKYETVFLIDSSASMSEFSDEIDSFLRECIDCKRDNEYYTIGLFSSENTPEYIADCVSDRYELEKSIDKIKYDYTVTYIYDNLLNLISNMNTDDAPVYRRIVLFTDGNENSENGITVDDIISKIKDDKIQIYTVTMQTAKRDNLQRLKTIARLSRESSASDIRLADNSDVSGASAILFSDAKNTYCINVLPEKSLLDGSVKAVEISDGSIAVMADVRMPMSDIQTVETEASVVESDDNDEAVENQNVIFIVLISVIAVIAVVALVVLIVNIAKSSNKKTETDAPQPFFDKNEETEIFGASNEGQTEMFFGENSENSKSLILRDINDSYRIFEVTLTANGVVIGRSPEFCNVVIDYDKSVSRRHCRISLKNGQAYIEDLSSGNKTYINGRELHNESVLNNADVIKLGRIGLKVTIK